MKTSYSEYLERPKHLTVEQMEKIHCQILDEIAGDVDAEEIYDELVEKATRYAAFRAEWILWGSIALRCNRGIKKEDIAFDATSSFLNFNLSSFFSSFPIIF